ncbi:MAG: cyclic nucleotide-binding domain-containing protein [Vicinamibacteria bacterium]|jgi:CRP-like cAMP-binding protein|nr:cyclic nucleotide-binding domain-containing protein [Vicinamibacteria bacterium]
MAIDSGFLKASDLFENQPDEVLRATLDQGHIEEFGPGAVVFRQGDRGDRLYIVKTGVLEILATPRDGSEAMPVAYLGAGEVLGELALLTGSPRSATARSPEHAELFTLEKAVFDDLMATLPAFARNMCVVLAKRLEATTLKIPKASTKQLQGNLRFFDLATVIQTLIGSHQNGVLAVIEEDSKNKIAEILFFKGNISRAKFRHLTGDDAVFQLFQTQIQGEFSFTGKNLSDEDVHQDISMPAISLLMESVRLQDELPVLKERFPDADRLWKQKAAQLAWEDGETVELAAGVWARLKKGASLNDLQREIPRCSYWIYKTIADLSASGQVE